MDVKPGYKQTEVGVIPEDWEVKNLGNVVTLQRGYDLPSRLRRPGSFPIVTSSGIEDFHCEAKVKGPGVVTGRYGTIGEVFWVPGDFWPLNTTLYVRNFFFNIPLFAFYLIRTIDFKPHSGKSGVPGVNRNDLHEILVPLPPTKAEQEAIAAALSDVDALIAALDRLIAKKRGLKQAAMQQLLTGQTRLAGFPGESDSVDFGDIAIIRNVKVISSSAPAGTQCVELDSVGQGTGQLLGSIDASGSSSKYSFKKGDVLFGRLRAYLRKYWLASFDGICSTEIWPLIPRDERLCAGYLHLLVQTNGFVDAAGVSYGTHMPRSDWSVLSKFTVSLPSVAEQTAIATFLSDMDAELAALESRRNKTRALKQAMMQELLTGRTRLVQPEDVAHAQVRV